MKKLIFILLILSLPSLCFGQYVSDVNSSVIAGWGFMQDEDINTFSELQSWVSDKTLVNEEDIFTIDANWVNTANPWADNEIATSANWNFAYDSVLVWDNRGYPQATTSLKGIAAFNTDNFIVNSGVVEIEYVYSTDIVNQEVKKNDLDSTSSDFVFNDAYRITSAESDSMFMTKKYIDDAAGGLTNQSVKGDHVDSTSEDFVFDDPYKGSSADAVKADSILVTAQTVRLAIEDSLNAYPLITSLEDSLDFYLLLAGGTMTGNITMSTNGWIGLGSGAGRIEFDDEAIDEVNILGANVGIGTTSPDEKLHVTDNNAALKLEDDSGNDATISVGNSQLCIAIDPDDLVVSSDICFDIDGDEVARFHQNSNVSIGALLIPPEKLSVVGNIATGDTAEADVDVYHYFSTDGSWTTQYLMYDDGEGRFKFSAPVLSVDTLTGCFVIGSPDDTYDFPFWQTKRAITIVAVSAVCTGGTNVIGALDEYNATGTSVDAAVDGDWTITTSEYTDASFTNAGIDAGDWIGFHITSVSGSVTFLSLTFEYVEQ